MTLLQLVCNAGQCCQLKDPSGLQSKECLQNRHHCANIWTVTVAKIVDS